ncbi:MAG: transcription antitermination factor NusB [Bauldia litoralis]
MPEQLQPTRGRRSNGAGRRSASRLAAVQALYQIDVTDVGPDAVMAEFLRYRLHAKRKGPKLGETDQAHFVSVVRGASEQRETLDRMLGSSLSEGWSLERMDRVLCATLRAGAWELFSRGDIPARVVITEYVDVANAFFDGREPGFVNGILDKLAHVLRPDEFGESGAGTKPAAS